MRRPKPTEIEQYLYNTVILFIFITNSLPAACYAKDFTSLPQKMIVDQICGTAIVQTTVYIKENHRNTSYEKYVEKSPLQDPGKCHELNSRYLTLKTPTRNG